MATRTRFSVKPRQSLGQNFLVDDNIGRNIVRDLHLREDDVVVEIGPGLGALTRLIAGKSRHLVALEIDDRVVEELRRQFDPQSVTILHQDILTASLREIGRTYGAQLRLVGNIPYHLTSPILFKAFEEREALRDCTLMMQREVALRLTAEPNTKEYGIPAVFTQFYGTPEILFNVSPNCFYPKPKVTSSVVRITFRPERERAPVDGAAFAAVVKTSFGKRRKTLRNSFRYLPYDENITEKFLLLVGEETLEKRPEDLTVAAFVDLARILHSVTG